MINEFDDKEGGDLIRNVYIDEQISISRARQSSEPVSQQVVTLTSHMHQLEEQVCFYRYVMFVPVKYT